MANKHTDHANQCEYLIKNRCLIAEKIARAHDCNVHCKVNSDTCEFCLKEYNPKSENTVTAAIAVDACRKNQLLTEQLYNFSKELLEEDVKNTFERFPKGPGTLLHHYIGLLGFEITDDCSCKFVASQMNKYGIEWCRNNMDYIVNSIASEAKKRKIPIIRMPIKALVEFVLNKAEKENKK